MKKHIIFTTALVLFIVLAQVKSLVAQSSETPEFKTLFDTNKPVKISGLGGPIVEFSSVGNNELGVSVGGGGAVLVNNLFFGGYGIGLATYHYSDLKTFDPVSGIWKDHSSERINFGHGGFWLGGLINPADAVHFAVSTRVGWGSLSLYDEQYMGQHYNYFTDNVFVLNPQVEVEMNMARWLKINVGVGYRLVTGANKTYDYYNDNGNFVETRKYFNSKDYCSPEASISFIFGWFW